MVEIDGQEYELASYGKPHDDGSRGATLRLVKQQPKWEINVSTPWMITAKYSERLTLAQAQLIKEAVEALMEWFNRDGSKDSSGVTWNDLTEILLKARTAIQGGK